MVPRGARGVSGWASPRRPQNGPFRRAVVLGLGLNGGRAHGGGAPAVGVGLAEGPRVASVVEEAAKCFTGSRASRRGARSSPSLPHQLQFPGAFARLPEPARGPSMTQNTILPL